MPDSPFQHAVDIIEEECRPLLEMRSLKIHRQTEWWGAGLTLENTGHASLLIFADFRDQCVDVNFMSSKHLDEKGTFVTFPYFDSPHHRFGLWEVLRARELPFDQLTGALNPQDAEALKAFAGRAVMAVMDHCLDVLDGDLSVTARVAELRSEPTKTLG